MSYVEAKDSKKLKAFLESSGIKIYKKKSCYNMITLKNKDGLTLELWAELESIGGEFDLAGIFVEE